MFVQYQIMFLVILFLPKRSSGNHSRRVVDGIIVKTRKLEYEVIRYYTWIGNGHNCDDTIFREAPSNFCSPGPENLLCGGSLVTPIIVQTAGHCVASFSRTEYDADNFSLGIKQSHWEQLREIYVGGIKIENFERIPGVQSKRFIMHQKFSALRNSWPNWNSHDLGWIVLSKDISVVAREYEVTISYAPVYTKKGLVKTWQQIMKTQATCLYVGFGSFRLRYKDDEGNEVVNFRSSSDLRYGWGVNIDYTTCYALTMLWPYNRYKFDYIEKATWSCSLPFGRNKAHPSHGDSGGPITCNGYYFGVVSQGIVTPFLNSKPHLTLAETIIYTAFENTAEYRRKFIASVQEYVDKDHNAWTVHPVLSRRPPALEFILYESITETSYHEANGEASSWAPITISPIRSFVLTLTSVYIIC